MPNEINDSVFTEAVPIKKNESPRAYQALLDFCVLGYTLGELSGYYSKCYQSDSNFIVPATIKELKAYRAAFDWDSRRTVYQMRLAAARERDLNNHQDDLQIRFSTLINQAVGRVEEMLSYPLTEQRTVESIKITPDMVGSEIVVNTVISPADWSISSAATLVNSITAMDEKQRSQVDRMITTLRRKGYTISLEGEEQRCAIEALEWYEEMPKMNQGETA